MVHRSIEQMYGVHCTRMFELNSSPMPGSTKRCRMPSSGGLRFQRSKRNSRRPSSSNYSTDGMFAPRSRFEVT